MPGTSVIGTQWGDEGKGKILDLLAKEADLVVRFQGGANAGHTVDAEGRQFVFHLLPSGVLHEGTLNLIGNGVVVDPEQLLAEIDAFVAAGVDFEGRLFLSGRAHLVMPYHKRLDEAQEKKRARKIGTTHRGIGPCYAEKSSRTGLRFSDLVNFERFRSRLDEILPLKNAILSKVFDAAPIDRSEILETFERYGRRLGSFVADTGAMIRRAMKEDKRVFFEGAQGALLDVEHGTYPFVTSSNSCALGIAAGAGVPPQSVGKLIGVMKAYTTRVGEGPFPTEGDESLNEKLRDVGKEFGATTGRPRRCGWLDGVAARYVISLNGINGLALTKLDVLDGFEKLKVCTAYRMNHAEEKEFPEDTTLLEAAEPLYDELPGWKSDISACRFFDDLPPEARSYVKYLEELLEVPVEIISVGPGREQTIMR